MDNSKRILLVEDSENDIELMMDALKEVNIKAVDICKNGMEALDYVLARGKYEKRINGNPAVVLLDIKMPKISGLELLRRMKDDDYLNTIPVVMLTSSKEESDIIKSYSLGANSYIVKPVDIEKFSDTIKQIGQFWLLINEPPPVKKSVLI